MQLVSEEAGRGERLQYSTSPGVKGACGDKGEGGRGGGFVIKPQTNPPCPCEVEDNRRGGECTGVCMKHCSR